MNFVWISLGVTWSVIALSVLTLRQNRKLIEFMREQAATYNELSTRQALVIRALAYRVSAHGHVDLSEEELKADSVRLEIHPLEDGIRVLVK